jgi:hypothetical protein
MYKVIVNIHIIIKRAITVEYKIVFVSQVYFHPRTCIGPFFVTCLVLDYIYCILSDSLHRPSEKNSGRKNA